MDYAPPVVTESAEKAAHAVIWLHGLGADGYDFVPVVRELNFAQKSRTRFVFPHAASLAVTINGGVRMPAWYDILELQIDRRIDEKQLRESARYVQGLISQQVQQGIAADKIIVAGFSQGGAVALEAALSHTQRLAGLMVLSSYFATAESIQCHPANSNLPILVQHGTQDGVVPEALGRKVHSLLSQKGYPVEYQTFPMAHSLCAQQVQSVSAWLSQTLG